MRFLDCILTVLPIAVHSMDPRTVSQRRVRSMGVPPVYDPFTKVHETANTDKPSPKKGGYTPYRPPLKGWEIDPYGLNLMFQDQKKPAVSAAGHDLAPPALGELDSESRRILSKYPDRDTKEIPQGPSRVHSTNIGPGVAPLPKIPEHVETRVEKPLLHERPGLRGVPSMALPPGFQYKSH